MTEPTFHTLSNGLATVLWPQNHLNSLVFGLYIRVGSRFESPEQAGITHFLEHVLFRGNASYSTSLEMNRTFESWGGSLNAYTTREYMYFHGRLHPQFLEECLAFVSALVRQPQFADIDLERNIILEERLQDVDSDGQLLEEDDVSRSVYWDEHPLGYPIIGTPKAIKEIDKNALMQHFQKYFGMRNAILCLNGKFDQEQASGLLETHFGDLPAGEAHTPPALPTPPNPASNTAFVHHDSSQIALLMSFRGPAPKDPSYVPMQLVDRILDDGMSSRLWQRIVEKRGLCYDLWTSIDTYHDISIFDIGASVAPERAVELVEEIYREIVLLREKGPSADELAHARQRWIFRQSFLPDHAAALNEHLGGHVLYDTYTPLVQQRQRMEAITLDNLNNITQQMFQPERHILTAVGPLRKSLKRRLRTAMEML